MVAGAATWNKLLLAGLVVALVAGLLAVGPRRLPWRWLLAGAVAGLVIASPNLVYQATNGWPQLAMGAGSNPVPTWGSEQPEVGRHRDETSPQVSDRRAGGHAAPPDQRDRAGRHGVGGAGAR